MKVFLKTIHDSVKLIPKFHFLIIKYITMLCTKNVHVKPYLKMYFLEIQLKNMIDLKLNWMIHLQITTKRIKFSCL